MVDVSSGQGKPTTSRQPGFGLDSDNDQTTGFNVDAVLVPVGPSFNIDPFAGLNFGFVDRVQGNQLIFTIDAREFVSKIPRPFD